MLMETERKYILEDVRNRTRKAADAPRQAVGSASHARYRTSYRPNRIPPRSLRSLFSIFTFHFRYRHRNSDGTGGLRAGENIIWLYIDSRSFNIDHFTLSKTGTVPTVPTPSSATPGGGVSHVEVSPQLFLAPFRRKSSTLAANA